MMFTKERRKIKLRVFVIVDDRAMSVTKKYSKKILQLCFMLKGLRL